MLTLAALAAGLLLSFTANRVLDLGQSVREQVECGLMWGAGNVMMFVIGTQLLYGY